MSSIRRTKQPSLRSWESLPIGPIVKPWTPEQLQAWLEKFRAEAEKQKVEKKQQEADDAE